MKCQKYFLFLLDIISLIKIYTMNMNFETLKAILDDIQQDLADFQNQKGIGMMDDNQWADLFIERVVASITTYEQLKEN